MELHELGVEALGQGYRNGEFIPTEVVEALLDRIATIGPSVDAFAVVAEEAARQHAAEAEQALAEGDDRPLLGIPVALKDLIDTAAIATEAGSEVFSGRVPDEDAVVWSALRSAGCVLLGKTRTHEFAFGSSTPPTNNPWSLDRTPGGSSGGSAAALAAGLTPAAVGTDTGGSIRIPSGLCGTVGFKPSQHLVPTVGVVPLSWTLDHVGPMARSPADCHLLLEAMTPGTQAREKRHEVLPGARVALVSNPGPLTDGVQAGVERATAAIEDAGAEVEPVEVPGFESCVDVDFTIIGAEAALYHRPWFQEQRRLYTPEVQPRIAAGYDITREEYLRARGEAEPYRRLFVDILDERDFLLVAGMPAPAPPHGSTKVQMGAAVDQFDRALCRNTSFANLTGLPSLALPSGQENGLPIGVQLAGGYLQDFSVLEAGQELWERLAPPPLAPL